MLGATYGLGAAITWAIGNALIKSQVGSLSSSQILFIRAMAGVPPSLLAVAFLPSDAFTICFTADVWLALVGSVVLGYFGGDLIFVKALEYTSLARGFPIQASYPLLAVLLAWALGVERVTWMIVVGAAIVVAGVALISRETAGAGDDHAPLSGRSDLKGLVLSGASAVCWGGSAVLLGYGLGERHAIMVNAVIAVLTASCYLPVSQPMRTFRRVREDPRLGVNLGLAGAFGGTGVSNMLYVLAVDATGVSRAAVLAGTAPLFSAFFAVTLLGERMTVNLAIGTLLNVVGIALLVGG
jgi:drug/metabolite transporter (DMT)-like permease